MPEGVLREVTLALPMVPEMELEASKTAAAIAESIRMSPDTIDEIRLAVVEACINALEHSQASEVYATFQILGGGGCQQPGGRGERQGRLQAPRGGLQDPPPEPGGDEDRQLDRHLHPHRDHREDDRDRRQAGILLLDSDHRKDLPYHGPRAVRSHLSG